MDIVIGINVFCCVFAGKNLRLFLYMLCARQASIVNGARGSGATVKVFRHNDAKQLEEIIREAIVGGITKTRRPWKKILVMVEGVYSMEGEICDLKSIVEVVKKCVVSEPRAQSIHHLPA